MENLCIVKHNGKCGIKRNSDGKIVLEMEYDNITFFHHCHSFYLLIQNGKMGLCKVVEKDSEYSLDTIVPCVYDWIYRNNDIILMLHRNETRYYNIYTNRLSGIYQRMTAFENCDYIQVYNGTFYIIDKKTDEIVYQETAADRSFPAFDEIGVNKEGYPMFRSDFNMFYKSETGYKYSTDLFFDFINKGKEIIVNIAESVDGIGLADNNCNRLTDIHYDTIQADIKLTLTKNGESIEKIIPYAEYEKDDEFAKYRSYLS